MKNILSFAFVLLCISRAVAQTGPGSQNLGLNLGYSNTTTTTVFSNPTYTPSTLTTTSKQATYSVAPAYSVFVSKGLDLGLAIGLTGSSTNYDYAPTPYTPTKTDYLAYSGTVYLRKYFLYADKIGIRTGPFFLYQQSTQKNVYPPGSTFNNNTDNKVNSYSTGINLDFVFYPVTKIGLGANICSLGYSYQKSTTADGVGSTDATQKTFNANFLANNLSLSVFWVFGK